MIICCANFVPVKVRISYNFDLSRLSALAAPCLSSFHTVRSIMVTIKLRIKCKRRNNIVRDSFPCTRIELELNKQSPFAVALIAEKHLPLTWLTSAGIKHVVKSSWGRFWRIRSLAVLISFLNTSSFLVNILFASSKFTLIRRTLKADNSWSFAYIVKQREVLLPEPEIRNEDFLEISWVLHDVVWKSVPAIRFSARDQR